MGEDGASGVLTSAVAASVVTGWTSAGDASVSISASTGVASALGSALVSALASGGVVSASSTTTVSTASASASASAAATGAEASVSTTVASSEVSSLVVSSTGAIGSSLTIYRVSEVSASVRRERLRSLYDCSLLFRDCDCNIIHTATTVPRLSRSSQSTRSYTFDIKRGHSFTYISSGSGNSVGHCEGESRGEVCFVVEIMILRFVFLEEERNFVCRICTKL